MKRTVSCIAVLAVCGLAATVALSQQPAKDTKPTTPPAKAAQPAKPGDHALPPGMTEADMAACMAAATPGPMHAHLTKSIGTWSGKVTCWMGPEPSKSECTTVVTGLMEGRFTRCEVSGEMPDMGPFQGFGVYGYDNVAKKFQSTWFDSMGTGMMVSTGDLSSDGKTLTWVGTYNCPMQKGPVTMGQVETYTGKDSMKLEMYGPDPETRKEKKFMEIVSTRTSGGPTASVPASKNAK